MALLVDLLTVHGNHFTLPRSISVPSSKILDVLEKVLVNRGVVFSSIPEFEVWYLQRRSVNEICRSTTPLEQYGEPTHFLDVEEMDGADPESFPSRESAPDQVRSPLLNDRINLLALASVGCGTVYRYHSKNFHDHPRILELYKLSETDARVIFWCNRIYYLESPHSHYFRHFFEVTGIAPEETLRRNGSRFEVIDLTILQNPEKKLTDIYWSSWETLHGAIKIYRSSIYPMFMFYIDALIGSITRGERRVSISDFGCGSGNLASMILEKNGCQISHYSMLELNQKEVEVVKFRFQDRLTDGSVSVIQGDAASVDCYQMPQTDIVICCGLLTAQVLENRDDALHMLRNIAEHVAPHGYLIISGFASLFINADDLKLLGFQISNMYCPEFDRAFYVAQRIS
jgi:SAM-dependent methyltransferase